MKDLTDPQYWDNFAYEEYWTPEEIAEACEKTAEVLQGHWMRGEWYEPSGSYCIEGALAAVLGFNPQDLKDDGNQREFLFSCPVYQEVKDTIDHIPGMDCRSMTGWNDEEAKNEQEVLDVLHRTAKRVLGVPNDEMEVTH